MAIGDKYLVLFQDGTEKILSAYKVFKMDQDEIKAKTLLPKEIEEKSCSVCGTDFKPIRTTDKVCSGACAGKAEKAREKAGKEQKKASKKSERKILFETAEIVFNTFIRKRDEKEPCICCGRPLGVGYHAGHYYSGGGHAAVKFDEDNVHGQRADCNTGHAADMIERYGVRLEEKIGKDMFEFLRAKAYETKHWTADELRSIIREYKQKTKELC